MALIVQKFGGTSVASTDRIKNVAKRVARWKAMGHDIIVVPSAMSGETNRLIALAKEISASPDPRELEIDRVVGGRPDRKRDAPRQGGSPAVRQESPPSRPVGS